MLSKLKRWWKDTMKTINQPFQPATIRLIDNVPDHKLPIVGQKYQNRSALGDKGVITVTGFDPEERVVTYYTGEHFPVNKMCVWMFVEIYPTLVKDVSHEHQCC